MMDNLEQLVETWTQCKKAEQMSMETRRKIEDRITDLLELDLKTEGTVNLDVSGYKMRIALRRIRKVDSDLLQEVAAEHGIVDRGLFFDHAGDTHSDSCNPDSRSCHHRCTSVANGTCTNSYIASSYSYSPAGHYQHNTEYG